MLECFGIVFYCWFYWVLLIFLCCVIKVMKWLNSGEVLWGFGFVLGWFWKLNVGLFVWCIFCRELLNNEWCVVWSVFGKVVLFVVKLWFWLVIIIVLVFMFFIGWFVLWWLNFIFIVLVLLVKVSSWWLRYILKIGILVFRYFCIVLMV